jgi:hypothetical protein
VPNAVGRGRDRWTTPDASRRGVARRGFAEGKGGDRRPTWWGGDETGGRRSREGRCTAADALGDMHGFTMRRDVRWGG